MNLTRLLKRVLPQSTRNRLKHILRDYRYMRNRAQSKIEGQVLTGQGIISGLEALGIARGDAIIVHSSLSRLGVVDGGPAAVVASLRQLVGEQGTVMVPTIHLRSGAVEHFADDPLFDVRSTRSTMGAIAEALRTIPEARRSIHPTHSAAAIGKYADYLTRDHHRAEIPFGPHSPYYRLAELEGKVVLLGVPLANMTNFHVIEDIMGKDFPYPVYLPDLVHARVADWDGREFRMDTRVHNPKMSERRRCNEMESHLVARGVATVGLVGSGRTMILDAARLNRVLLELAQQNVTMYTPDGVIIESMLKDRRGREAVQ